MFKETSDGETLYVKRSFKTYEKDVNKYLEKCKQILGKMQTNTWKVPCLIKKMSGFQILAWCERALKWGKVLLMNKIEF